MNKPNIPSIGFIILRHVNTLATDKYWKYSYTCIRKLYPQQPILVIDDCSNYDVLDVDFEKQMTNTTVIQSEYPARGELLPYIYFLSNKHCEIAVIIHDSVFINKYIDFTLKTNEPYKFVWQFESGKWDDIQTETTLISVLNDNHSLLQLYNNTPAWKGCFGGMTIIRHSFLKQLHERHNLYNLIPHINTRPLRCCFERVIACVLQLNGNIGVNSLLGDIHKYCRWGVGFNAIRTSSNLPIIKVWTGR